jgi:hypothetical protein
MKKGAPINAVMTPTGNSLGEMIVLATVSAAIRKTAPPKAETGIKRRWSEPRTILPRWGTIRPTNPIRPEKETTRPITNETTRKHVIFVLFVSTPNWSAVSSPAVIKLRCLERP